MMPVNDDLLMYGEAKLTVLHLKAVDYWTVVYLQM